MQAPAPCQRVQQQTQLKLTQLFLYPGLCLSFQPLIRLGQPQRHRVQKEKKNDTEELER